VLEHLREIGEQLAEASFELDPSLLNGADAIALVGEYVRIERMAAAGRLRAAHRVEQTKAYTQAGHRSAASWLAAAAGISTAQAGSALITAEQLEGLNVTAASLAAGFISEAEAREIASASSVDASAEADLLAAAPHASHRELRDEAQRRRAAALGQKDRDERIHARRGLSEWSDAEGATCVHLRMTPDAGARLLTAVDARAEQIFADAYRAGRREPLKAYRLDALLALVEDARTGQTGGSGRGADVCVNVLIDYAALVRGSTEPGERCEIAGVGPITVATARRLLSDSVLKLIVSDGVDVYNVTHAGRTIPAHLRSALLVRDQVCCRPGCGERKRLETHHYNVDYAHLPQARLANLARLCHWDHRLATLGKGRLSGSPGRWEWTDVVDRPTHPPPQRLEPAVA